MTEAEWLACEEPETLVAFLRTRASPRKARLLAAALCRHVLPLVGAECGRRAVAVAEHHADGLATLESMLAASEQVADAYVALPNPGPVNTDPPLAFKAESVALQATRFLTRDADDYLEACCRCTHLAALRWVLLRAGSGEAVAPYTTLVRWQRSLIYEVAGSPFRPVDTDLWRTSTVVALAEGIYRGGAFDRLPILADALQDAGCENEVVLAHCRGDGTHVKGCWVIDLLTGRV